MNNYLRVIPRDFFNESKLLKCLGKLSIAILDNKTKGLKLREEFNNESFKVVLDHAGYLYVENYKVYLNKEQLFLFTPYNSRSNYPLQALYKDEYYQVLDEYGKFVWIKE